MPQSHSGPPYWKHFAAAAAAAAAESQSNLSNVTTRKTDSIKALRTHSESHDIVQPAEWHVYNACMRHHMHAKHCFVKADPAEACCMSGARNAISRVLLADCLS